tara:strand:+ start:2181 stop:2705 length:525 start_codon:yes stop_codon:yes gene_type:complete
MPESKTVFLAENVSFKLTAPPAEKVATLDSHLVQITSKDKENQFITQVEYRRNEIAMAAISPEGLPLFDFIWFSNKTSEINQYVPLPNVDIGFIIADIQLCNWPLHIIESAISGANIRVSQQLISNKKHVIWQRTITQNNNVIIKIEKLLDGYELENIVHGYRIRLTDLNRNNS